MVSKNNTIAIFKDLLFVLFLLGQCPIASGQVTYSVLTKKFDSHQYAMYAEQISGQMYEYVCRTNLRTKAGCEAAAVSMGISDTSATVISSKYLPPGCVVENESKDEALHFLYFNTDTGTRTYNRYSKSWRLVPCGIGSNWNCKESSKCAQSTTHRARKVAQNCICANGPFCSETDGTTANSAGCICGVSPCTATTGLFCVQHKKQEEVQRSECLHSAISACSNINGTSTNSLPCLCGTKTCTSSTGLFCLASLSTCNTKIMCSVTDGSAVNSGSCACGTSDCDSSTGLFCDVHQNRSRCLATRVCPNEDGLEPNAATCKCGPTDSCDANTFCNANALEGSACSAPLDCAITVDEMFEQMPNCTRFNNRCKCTQCSRGFYTDDCSVVCPSRAVSILVDSVYLFGAFWFTLAYIVSGCYFFFPVFSLSLFGIVFSSYTYTPNQPLSTHK